MTAADSPAIIIADRNGVIRVWNDAAEQMFGHRANEAVGRTLDLIVPERYRAAHWAGFHSAIERRAAKNDGIRGNLPLLHSDGSEGHHPGRLVFLSDALGNAVGAMGIFLSNDAMENNGLPTVP